MFFRLLPPPTTTSAELPGSYLEQSLPLYPLFCFVLLPWSTTSRTPLQLIHASQDQDVHVVPIDSRFACTTTQNTKPYHNQPGQGASGAGGSTTLVIRTGKSSTGAKDRPDEGKTIKIEGDNFITLERIQDKGSKERSRENDGRLKVETHTSARTKEQPGVSKRKRAQRGLTTSSHAPGIRQSDPTRPLAHEREKTTDDRSGNTARRFSSRGVQCSVTSIDTLTLR